MITSLGTCRFVMPLLESTIASSGRDCVHGGDVGFDRGALGFRQRLDLRVQVADAVVRLDAELFSAAACFAEHVLVITPRRRGRT